MIDATFAFAWVFAWIGFAVVIIAAIPVLVIGLAWLYFKTWDQILKICNLNTILYKLAVKLANERKCKKDGREYKDREQLLAENKELQQCRKTLIYIRNRTGPLSEGIMDIEAVWEEARAAIPYDKEIEEN